MRNLLDILTENQRFWYVTMHNWELIVGGLLLWGTFVFVALIARRYAPSGILIYVLLSAVAYSQAKLMMPSFQRWIAYAAFLFSGLFSLGGALQFFQIIAPSLRRG